MKSKELIRQLQEEDPTGEVEVCVGNVDIYFVSKEPAYYDGDLQVLIRDEKLEPYFDVVSAKRIQSGNKLQVHTLSIRDFLFGEPDAPIEYPNDSPRSLRYKENDDRVRAAAKKMNEDHNLQYFTEWAVKHSKKLYPDIDVYEVKQYAQGFYDEQGLHYEEELQAEPGTKDSKGGITNASWIDRLFYKWDQLFECIWDGFDFYIKKKE